MSPVLTNLAVNKKNIIPQMKRCEIITYQHGIYELPQELPNILRLRILGN